MCVSVPSTSERDEWTGPLQELSGLARPDVGAAVDLVQRGAVRGPVEHAPQWPARGSGGLVHGVQVERKALHLLASAEVERVEQAVGREVTAQEDRARPKAPGEVERRLVERPAPVQIGGEDDVGAQELSRWSGPR